MKDELNKGLKELALAGVTEVQIGSVRVVLDPVKTIERLTDDEVREYLKSLRKPNE